jgi:hypothetical protein
MLRGGNITVEGTRMREEMEMEMEMARRER